MNWSPPGFAGYLAACRDAADTLMRNPMDSQFKRDPRYRGIVGNDCRGREVAERLYRHLRDIGMEPLHIRAATIANDRYGGGVLHELEGARYSAAALRYAQVAALIAHYPAVVEIGGGYGGQCVACAVLGLRPYMIFDVPEALFLARVYTGLASVSFTGVVPEDYAAIPEEAVCISDFALTELDQDGIDWYLRNVVSRCLAARITGVFSPYFMARLRAEFRFVDLAVEKPPLSAHVNEVATCWRRG